MNQFHYEHDSGLKSIIIADASKNWELKLTNCIIEALTNLINSSSSNLSEILKAFKRTVLSMCSGDDFTDSTAWVPPKNLATYKQQQTAYIKQITDLSIRDSQHDKQQQHAAITVFVSKVSEKRYAEIVFSKYFSSSDQTTEVAAQDIRPNSNDLISLLDKTSLKDKLSSPLVNFYISIYIFIDISII
jgi:hypothetical protein